MGPTVMVWTYWAQVGAAANGPSQAETQQCPPVFFWS